MVVIVTYALYMSFDTDLNQAAIITATAPFFIISEQLFCFYFTLELFIRFMAFERKCNSFKDAWFVFDFALVFMMVAETWATGLHVSGILNANIHILLKLLALSSFQVKWEQLSLTIGRTQSPVTPAFDRL